MEMKEIVLSSYELLVKLPSPKNEGDKFKIDSRNKLKNLPEALRENNDADNVSHFVKYASYFLPRAEKGDKTDPIMLSFLDLLLLKIRNIEEKNNDPGEVVKNIKYLIGYTNWNMDAVLTIFTASKGDDEKIRNRLRTMLGAELEIIDAKENIEKIVSEIIKWKNSPGQSDEKKHFRPQINADKRRFEAGHKEKIGRRY